MKHAVMLIIKNEGCFLFVKRHPQKPAGGYWCPVSGRVEPNESQPNAVVREALEEVGLHVRPVAHLGSIPCSTGEYLLHWWATEIISGKAQVLACDEITEVRWVHPDDFKNLEPSFKEDLVFILSHGMIG